MVKITDFLIAVVAVCGSLVGSAMAQVVIHRPIPVISGGVTQIVSASVAGVSVIGVQANGATLYAATEIESLVAVASGTRTSTLLSTPTTIVLTFAEGASYYSASAAEFTTVAGRPVSVGVEVICTGTGNGGEVKCNQANVASAVGIVTTLKTNFVATTSPIFTLDAQSAVPTIGSNGGSSAGYSVHALSAVSLSFCVGIMSIVLRTL